MTDGDRDRQREHQLAGSAIEDRRDPDESCDALAAAVGLALLTGARWTATW